ncbi:hypothetical protein [Haloarcula sp. JP-L23]|uniref:hypothetical protein n=1 Tax=Haloarcula sp. JP-L23 TaxID=2716717 RepID=UPI00140F3C98|nr:hypothetical protein G9465_12290 [Haloarcula sp. JP-L23]
MSLGNRVADGLVGTGFVAVGAGFASSAISTTDPGVLAMSAGLVLMAMGVGGAFIADAVHGEDSSDQEDHPAAMEGGT